MKKVGVLYSMVALGLLLLGVGLYFIKADQASAVLPYLCVGIGCGVFGHGLGEIISRNTIQSSPAVAKRIEVEEKDERNIALRNRAQAKAYTIMVPVFGALLVSFALMSVDVVIILLLVAAYLFVCGCNVYYRIKYEKEM